MMRPTTCPAWLATLLITVVAATASPAHAASDTAAVGAGLPYPPAARPRPDDIVHVATGLPLDFGGLMELLAGARLVYVGETHDNPAAHRVQLRILRGLEERHPGRVALALEMFRSPQQPVLDRWSRGELDEAAFLAAVDWQRTWGLDFGHYRDLLAFARERRLDVIALNPPRELQDAVKRTDIDTLPEALCRQLPELGPPDPYQRRVLEAVYRAHRPTGGDFEAFFRVQRLWEESMAERLADYLRSTHGAGKIVVVLTGGAHVEHGFGVPKKLLRRLPLPYLIVLPTEIEVPAAKRMPVVPPALPLAPADVIWWVDYEELAPAAAPR